MKVLKILCLLLAIQSTFSAASLFQSAWYTSYTPAVGTTADYHTIGMSFSTTLDAQVHTGLKPTPIITAERDNDDPNLTSLGTISPINSTKKRLQNFIPLIEGANVSRKPYVIYDISRNPCVSGEQPFFTAKIRYFKCIESANAFADSLKALATPGDNFLTHKGTDFVEAKSGVKTGGDYADVAALIGEVKGGNTTACS
jgi:hypothetical protein